MFWQRTWEKATEKGHRQVLGAEGTRADLSNEEVMVAEAEILLKPALLHNCKLNQEPQLSLLLSHKTKSTLYLFLVPGSQNQVTPLAQTVQVCTASLCTDFFLEVISSYAEFLKSLSFQKLYPRAYKSRIFFLKVNSRPDNIAWATVTMFLITPLPLPTLHTRQRQAIAPGLGWCLRPGTAPCW